MERTPVQSSSLKSIGHDGDVIEVEFHSGRVYRHRGASREDFDRLLNAESVGRHYNAHIKGTFDHELVDTTGIETESARARE